MDMGVFEALSESNEPLTLEELADFKGSDIILMGNFGLQIGRSLLMYSQIERILRLLTSIGYIEETDVRTYAANALTRQLTDRGSIGAMKWMYAYLFMLLDLTSLLK